MRKLLIAALLFGLSATPGLALYPFPKIPSSATAAPPVHTVVIVTPSGSNNTSVCTNPTLVSGYYTGTCTVPSNYAGLNLEVEAWGSGQTAGAGGGYAGSTGYTIPVGGTTVYYAIGATLGSGVTSANGNPTWVNFSTNASPATGAAGAVATTGWGYTASGHGGTGTVYTGAMTHTGGIGKVGYYTGGGGGGAGSAGDGAAPATYGNSYGYAGGLGGTPDGGNGGAACASSGVPAGDGVAPGGGGGAQNNGCSANGTGAFGQVRVTLD